MQMVKKLLVVGIIYAVIAVVLGALGAHALEKHLTIDQLKSFETGVRYQMYHALALILVASIPGITNKTKKIVLYFFFYRCYLILFKHISVNNCKFVEFQFFFPRAYYTHRWIASYLRLDCAFVENYFK